MPDSSPSDGERQLLDAVVAEPDSDAPRLAYADCIERRDPERAEFIRLSIDLARRTPKPDWADPISVWHRELETWFSQRVRDDGAGAVTFERGFVRWITLTSDVSLKRAAALFEANPLLRILWLFADSGLADSLASLPHLSRLTGLRVCLRDGSDQPDDSALARLIASCHLTSLRGLSFDRVGVGPRTARVIADSAALSGLEHLSICESGAFDSHAAAALAASSRLGNLHSLGVSNCAVRAEGCVALADSGLLARVTSLTLDGNWVGDEGARALAGAKFGACTTLRLKKAGIGDAGAVALAGSPAFEALETLDLSGNHVGDEGATAFARTPYFPVLARLQLQENAIGEGGAEALAGTEQLASLKVLGLDGNAIYTGEIEQWTDWDGTPVGSGPVRVSFSELKSRYERRFKLE